jgi:hypothetical protein
VTAPSGLGLNAKQLAQSLFDYVQQTYAAAADTAPLPARQVIAAGDIRLVAWDCEQFTVSLTGIDIDVPSQTPTTPGMLKATALRHVALTVQVVRCTAPMPAGSAVGTTKLPKPEDITAVGLQSMRDAGLVSQALFEWTTRAVSPNEPMGVLAAGVGAIIPVGPQGGLVGVEGQAIVTAALV